MTINTKSQSLNFHWRGLVPYDQALLEQMTAVEQVSAQGKAQILGFEHPKVITLGIRGEEEQDLSAPKSELISQGFQVVRVRRGGQATLHNPGQMVIYPILPLRNWGLGVKRYVEILEATCLSYLAGHGISATVGREEPGIYSSRGKMAFFGIQVKKGVSFHGASINLENQLEDFTAIRSCGKSKESFDAAGLYKELQDIEAEFARWGDCFVHHLSQCKF